MHSAPAAKFDIAREQALYLWRAKLAKIKRASEPRSRDGRRKRRAVPFFPCPTRVSFRVLLLRNFSQLPQTVSLQAG